MDRPGPTIILKTDQRPHRHFVQVMMNAIIPSVNISSPSIVCIHTTHVMMINESGI